MVLRYFFADLLCVFVPLFVIDVWQVRKANTAHKSYWSSPVMAVLLCASSVVSALFNFSVSPGVSVNLSIVPLTLAFYLLSWSTALFVLLFYAVAEILIGTWMMSHGHLTVQVLHTVASILPQSLVIVGVYAAMMVACSLVFKHQKMTLRALSFVGTLVCYTLIDYTYVNQLHPLRNFDTTRFIAYVLIYNLTFFLSIRLVVAGQRAWESKTESERLEKMQVISQLAASVAHELRNPITVIRGYTQLMLAEDLGRETTVRFLESMMLELNIAESAISNYLQLAKKQADTLETEVNMSRVVDYAIDALMPLAQNRNVALRCTVDRNISIYANQGQMTQVLLNVLKNAIESIDYVGVVEVTLRQLGDLVECTVRDSGRGIPKEQLAKLGQPFYSTKTEGTGLGMTLVYKVISDVRGKIEVNSQPGVGTTVTIMLPVYVGSTPRPMVAETAIHSQV